MNSVACLGPVLCTSLFKVDLTWGFP